LLVFIASSPGHVNDATWTWDGNDWTDQGQVGGPTTRTAMGMAYDKAGRRVAAFGGAVSCFETTCARRDTWTWDGTRWLREKTESRPRRRWNIGMAFDGPGNRVLLFGGCCAPSVMGDTWGLSGTTWTLLDPLDSPSPRDGPAMAWDAARREIILFG